MPLHREPQSLLRMLTRQPRRQAWGHNHAKNKIAGRFILFLVLGFWDKNTRICAGTMPYRWEFSATTRIQAFLLEAEKGLILPANVFLAWIA